MISETLFLHFLRDLELSGCSAPFTQLCYERVTAYCHLRSISFQDLTIGQLHQIFDCCTREFKVEAA